MAVTVDNKWLAANLDNPGVVILDTRGNMPYRFGHIKNALPLGIEMVVAIAQNGAKLVIDSEAAEKVFSSCGIDDLKKVVIYGEPDDPTPARVAWSLMCHGHPDTVMLDMGFHTWKATGLPVTREASQTALAQFKSKPKADIRIDAEIIKAKMGDPSFVVVDARTAQEHLQAKIPNSVLLNWDDGVGQNGSAFLSGEELKRSLRKMA